MFCFGTCGRTCPGVPSPTVDWLAMFQGRGGKGAQIKGSRDGIEAEKPRLGQRRFESLARSQGETGDAGGAATLRWKPPRQGLPAERAQAGVKQGELVSGGYVMPRAVLDGLDTSSSGPCLGSEGAASQPSWSWMFRASARIRVQTSREAISTSHSSCSQGPTTAPCSRNNITIARRSRRRGVRRAFNIQPFRVSRPLHLGDSLWW